MACMFGSQELSHRSQRGYENMIRDMIGLISIKVGIISFQMPVVKPVCNAPF